MTPNPSRQSPLQAHWVYGGGLAGIMLLALAPLLTAGLTPVGGMVYLCLVAYMLHQYEEHDDDRFRRFFNDIVLKGREGLTVTDVFIINVVGVWGVLALTLWATERLSPAWGLIAAYFLLINAVAHIGQAIGLRRANPGLWTAIALFLPVGLWTLQIVWTVASVGQHLMAALLILALHGTILLKVRRNLA